MLDLTSRMNVLRFVDWYRRLTSLTTTTRTSEFDSLEVFLRVSSSIIVNAK